MGTLEQFGIIPVDFATLSAFLGKYKSPGDKVSNLEKVGELIRLKKGMYVVSPKVHGHYISKELVANHLYGPSYVSLESALSYYKIIPERTYSVRSMVLKRSRKFSTSLGNFEYLTADKEYFNIGVAVEIIDNQYAFLIASPEKALCDLIIATPRIRIQSVKAMRTYLEEDLRADFSALENFDKKIIEQCIEVGKKKIELTQLYKVLEQ
jgi:predicted transcriptional regulator of viral defense system